VLKEDVELPDWKSRFAHSCNGFERYIFIFGGCGPYSAKLKSRAVFQETIAFDIETGKYCKFDGGRVSLQAEISDLKTQKLKENGSDHAMQGSTEQYKLDQAAMKDRISACTLVSSKARLEPEIWMLLRKKAVVDMPLARAHHVGAVLGAALFIHGGQSCEGNKTLSDWNSFDFGLQVWMKCSVKEVLPNESNQKFTHARK